MDEMTIKVRVKDDRFRAAMEKIEKATELVKEAYSDLQPYMLLTAETSDAEIKEAAAELYLKARAAAMRGENPSDVIYGDGQGDPGKAEDQPE